MPWTGHAYDAMAFLSHADRVFFGRVDPASLWPFGLSMLLAVLFSQAAVLFVPGLWNAMSLRLFWLKLPAWFADLGIAAIVRAFASDPAAANLWMLRYLADPAVFFVTVVHGQNDSLASLCATGGIALALLGRYELAGLVLGLGAGTKFYPAAFMPLVFVAALRDNGLRRASLGVLAFAAGAFALLAPVLWGRANFVVGAYANNSFGAQGASVSSASLWSLLPAGILRPQIEQLVAVCVPIALALWELRHRPQRVDVARAAMLSAIAIVALNPGVHPPFYLWIAGPLVLYAAVAGDGLVSLLGWALAAVSIGMQFCQEGSDEYFLLAFGPGPLPPVLGCPAPSPALAAAAALLCAAIAVAAWRRFDPQSGRTRGLAAASAALATIFVVVFSGLLAATIADAALYHGMKAQGYERERRAVNTFAVNPHSAGRDARCTLTYVPGDLIVYAGNPYAARFGHASLGYTLFSPERMTIRGRPIDVDSLPSTFENEDVRAEDQRPARVTQEFDVTPLLRPFLGLERFEELPCTLVRDNPLLIYRFDLPAAQAAAYAAPLQERLRVFSRTEDR